MMALAMTCMENGLVDGTLAYSFAHTISNLHSVAVYNRELYETTYRNARTYLAQQPTSLYLADCTRFNKEVPAGLPVLRARYEEIVQDRRRDAIGMSQSLASMGNSSFSNVTYIPVPMPSGQVTFGQSQIGPRINHFLVETGRGQRQCSVSESGYVLCH
jgi:hypothetical protein